MKDPIPWLQKNIGNYPRSWYESDRKRLSAMYRRALNKELKDTVWELQRNREIQIRYFNNLHKFLFGHYPKHDLQTIERFTKLVDLRTVMAQQNKSTRPLTVNIYVDGSYNTTTCEYGSGVVCISGGEVIHTHKMMGNDPIIATSRNVAGELRATMYSIMWANNFNATRVYIHYDYAGIEKWVTGEWKTNKEITRQYKEFMNSDSFKNLSIVFRKVKAHSNDKYNDMADKLAKEACGLA